MTLAHVRLRRSQATSGLIGLQAARWAVRAGKGFQHLWPPSVLSKCLMLALSRVTDIALSFRSYSIGLLLLRPS